LHCGGPGEGPGEGGDGGDGGPGDGGGALPDLKRPHACAADSQPFKVVYEGTAVVEAMVLASRVVPKNFPLFGVPSCSAPPK
jgi:hypothetical protein